VVVSEHPPQGQQARRPPPSPKRSRRPKFGPFLLTGAVVGMLVALVVDRVGPQVQGYGAGSVLGFLALSFAGLGALLGGLVAVLLDRRA